MRSSGAPPRGGTVSDVTEEAEYEIMRRKKKRKKREEVGLKTNMVAE